MTDMPHLLVIGGPSLDTLHFKNSTARSAGGAGLYTALAAARSGCKVSLFSPKPEPMPEPLQPLESRLAAWYGPVVTPEEVPRFTISHADDKATYHTFYVGAEARLNPEDLPDDLSIFNGVHITALGTARQQFRFAEACRARGARLVSGGSFLNLIESDPALVRAVMAMSDITFMNEEEACAIYGSLNAAAAEPGKVLFVTLGKAGAAVLQGDYRTDLPPVTADVLDPTGAGDTFCGGALSHVLQGAHPLLAARRAMALAAEAIEYVGPAALLFDREPPGIPLDARVRIDDGQVAAIAEVIKAIPEAEPFNFVTDYYPPVGHPSAPDFFFVQTLQQFSFWETQHGRYHRPLIAAIDGHQCKGSTYLSYAYMRPLHADPAFYTPQRQASQTREELLALFRADDGTDPMPALDLHLRKAQSYGKDMSALGLTSAEIVARANRAPRPLERFISILDHIGGYKEDPFRKKTNLLALILMERPERFLKVSADEAIQPVIDYHVMRFCLRTGLVDILEAGLREKIANRALVTKTEEWAIRHACYVAIQRLIDVSGLSMGAVDNVAFSYNRKHCPEMTEPVCALCALDPACAHRKNLFQPVIRTSFY